jgi:hypothetical protein
MFIMDKISYVSNGHSLNAESEGRDNDAYIRMYDNYFGNNKEMGMLRIECSEHTDWYPTVYMYTSKDTEPYDEDCPTTRTLVYKYTFPKQVSLEE